MNKIISGLGTLVLITGSLFLASCDRENEVPAEGGREYMPLEIGKYILYDVDSLYWDDFNKTEVPQHWQLQYQVVDTFRDLEGRLSYTINVYRRRSATVEFTPDKVIHVTPAGSSMEYDINNLTFINLTFPVSEGASWDGLAKISKEEYEEFNTNEWNFKYSKVGQPYENSLLYFDNTVTVDHIDYTINNPDEDSTAVAYKWLSKEIYAKGVGMVYKEFIYWEFMPAPPFGAGSGYRRGKSVRMSIVEHN